MRTLTLHVSRWGNSLAVRLPADYAKRSGIREGDTLALQEATDGTLSLSPARPFDRKAFAKRLEKATGQMPAGEAVIEELRRGSRY